MEEILMATATVSAATVEHPLRNPDYRLWLIGGTISLLGDQFYLVALPWLVLQQTGSAVAMGAIMMAGAIPRALLMLMGGAVSDRMSARKIMMATATARTIFVIVIGVLLWLRVLRTWELYALAFAFGVADAFAVPAQTAYMPSLLKREQLVAASSVSQSTGQLTTILGPVPAGFVIQTLGVAWAFFVDAISFLFIIGALWKLPDPPKSQTARKAMWHSIAEGIAYVGKDVPLRSLMLLATIMNFCIAGPVSIGLAYLTKTRFGSPAAYGVVISAVAAGSLLGALLAGVWKMRRRGVMILLASAVMGLCLGSIGLMGRVRDIAQRAAGDGGNGGNGQRPHRRLGYAADRCRGARASGKRAHACLLRGNAHLPRGCRILSCVEPEVHVSARWRTNGAGRRRSGVPEAGAGD
jgi:MFS family permease